ncbi:glucose 1-dehydrogenase [Ferroplasma acidiphilum]|uniref:Glucose 1-dehydrogenase n=1 Tax=Ferroplasma acidiphilum TaxID=74969 RepID=A0A7K4FPF5_9ARCH|nr:glucose 1-dehydrogenase [Ferroplasma acidiphilum]NOL60139.1 glucose 1-dehydrogenase [Ferroplasma acidiphilum]
MGKIDLTGKIAIVTGASGGIGKAIAISLASAGASVAVHFGRNKNAADEVVNKIVAANGKAIAVSADMADPSAVEEMFRKVDSSLGTVDILVNSAGIDGARAMLGDDDIENWKKVISINLYGPYFCSRMAIQRMKKKNKGVIINITSDHVNIPWEGYSAYCSSKAGLDMMAKTLAQETATMGIRVISIAPGAIKTAINKSVWENPDTLKDLNGKIAMGFPGDAEDVADAVLFAASDMAKYITGTTIVVDGGMLIYPDFRHGG